MSRPYLVHLLETEAVRIPVQKVGPGTGGHRRIRLRDVLAYRQTRDAENDTRIERSLEDLASEAEQTSAEASMLERRSAELATTSESWFSSALSRSVCASYSCPSARISALTQPGEEIALDLNHRGRHDLRLPIFTRMERPDDSFFPQGE